MDGEAMGRVVKGIWEGLSCVSYFEALMLDTPYRYSKPMKPKIQKRKNWKKLIQIENVDYNQRKHIVV